MRVLFMLSIAGAAATASGQAVDLGAASRATGGAGLAVASHSPFAWNPAALSERSMVVIGSGRLYGIAELAPVRLGLTTPRAGLPASITLTGLVLDGYSRIRAALGMRGGGNTSSVGLRIAATRVRAGRSLARTAVRLDGGIRHEIGAGWHVGIMLSRTALGRDRRVDPSEMGLGVSWSGSGWSMPLDVRRRGTSPPSLHAGFEARWTRAVRIMGGISTRPERLSAGIGIRLERWSIDFALDRHETLGLSNAIDVGLLL